MHTNRLEHLQDAIKEQAKRTTWNIHTVRHIIGSSFHEVIKCKDSSVESVLKQLMQHEPADLTVQAVEDKWKILHTAIVTKQKIPMNFNPKAVRADEPGCFA